MASPCPARKFYRFFSFSSSVLLVGAIGGAFHYQRTYLSAKNDTKALHRVLVHPGTSEVFDVAIVGGGIIGIATAREIRQRWPQKSVVLLEKEADIAQHQSGHSSGCIHAGMFYTPGTTMARLCPRGADMMTRYCKRHKLPYKQCGKLIVGSSEEDIPVIQQLYDNGRKNGVKGLEILLGEAAIQKKEPLVTGAVALYSKYTGAVDFGAVCRHMRDSLLRQSKGAFQIRYNFNVLDFVGVQLPGKARPLATEIGPLSNELVVIRGREEGQVGPEKLIIAKHVITCCGLGTDGIASKTQTHCWWGPALAQMFSFRGRYYQLRQDKAPPVKMHVYPCPDLSKGISVGVHVSPSVNEQRGDAIILGPGSAFACHPYGYCAYDLDLPYLLRSVFSAAGLHNLVFSAKTLFDTYRLDLSRKAFLSEVQKLVPSITMEDIEDSFTGVMGLGVKRDGEPCSDFSVEYARPKHIVKAVAKRERKSLLLSFLPEPEKSVEKSPQPLILHVRNAPSPAATAAMAIAEDIVTSAGISFLWNL